MTLHLPGFETILEHAVYTFLEQQPPQMIGREPARTVVIFSRFHIPSQREVLDYIQAKADEVTSVLQHSTETGEAAKFKGGIEWKLVGVPTDVRQQLALGKSMEELEEHFPESIGTLPQPYLLLQGGTIPQRIIIMGQSAEREREWYSKMMGVKPWKAELQLSSSGSLLNEAHFNIEYPPNMVSTQRKKFEEQALISIDVLYKTNPTTEDLGEITAITDYKLGECAETIIQEFLEKAKRPRLFTWRTAINPEELSKLPLARGEN